MSGSMAIVSTLLAIFLLCAPTFAARGSCRASRRCCDGKNSHCVAGLSEKSLQHLLDDNYVYDEDEEGGQDGGLFGTLSEIPEPCYCDHGCLEVGDCCDDFKDYCGVIDCQVGDWSPWSECDVECGVGTQVRTRNITRPEANGGEPCPDLQETRTCRATRCSRRGVERVSAPHETAMLLPGKYAARQGGRGYDVRSNLRSFRRKEDHFRYCAVFRVERAMGVCAKEEDTKELQRGHTVCVMCDSKAQREGNRCTGHGADSQKTRFKNLMNPRCHGKWVRLSVGEECPCEGGQPDFVFL